MNAERLLAHYKRFADTPDAIPRLRRFVLDLAIRGKLAPQDIHDQPVSELLNQISDEKQRLAIAGKFKSLDLDYPRDDSQFPFSIPVNWTWAYLDCIAAVARGGSPRPIKSYLTDDLGGIPWIKIGDSVRGNIYINKTKERIRPTGRKKSRLVVPGDLLLSNSMSFGYPYITNIEGCIHDGWLVIRAPEKYLDKLYLHTVLLSDHAKVIFSNAASGAVVQNLNADKVRLLPVPLPPLAEQHRIVAKVDELMTLCDTLETARTKQEATRDWLATASLARLSAPHPDSPTFQNHASFALENLTPLTTRPDQIKALRQAIINLGVHGKLVRQHTKDELAEETLKKIGIERDNLVQRNLIRREKSLDEIDGNEPPFRIPHTWCWARIGEVALFTQYGTSTKSAPAEQGVPVLTMGNIQDGGVVFGNEKKIPDESEELPMLFLRKLDLLYNRTNSAELVGKTGIYLGEDNRRTFASYLIRIRLSHRFSSPRYVNLAMNAPVFRETQIVPLIKKQTGQANVNGTALKHMLLPLPPLAEQHRIVAKVDELMAFCDRLEESLATSDATRRRLLDAVLHDALAPAADRKVSTQELRA